MLLILTTHVLLLLYSLSSASCFSFPTVILSCDNLGILLGRVISQSNEALGIRFRDKITEFKLFKTNISREGLSNQS